MKHVLQSETSFCNAPVTADANSVAQKHFEGLMGELTDSVSKTGLADDLSVMFRHDPLAAETTFRNAIYDLARSVMHDAFERIDDHGPSLDVEGERYRKVEPSTGYAMTLFGSVTYDRCRYRPCMGGGEAFIPTESVIGLTEGSMTPAAAGLSMALMSNLTARESEDIWKRLCSKGPSASTLVQLSSEAGQCFEDCSRELLADLRAEEELPEDAVTLQASLDGVMIRMHSETVEGSAIEAGWREASSGVVSLLDAEGNTLLTRYFGRLPETGKASLKAQVSHEVFYWMERNKDLKLVVTADGAKDNWTFLDTFHPDVAVLDFWHAAQHLKAAADAAFGPDSANGIAWFENWRHILRHDPKGIDKMIDALRYLLRKRQGCDEIKRELKYFRNNRKRMKYEQVARSGYPIGSGTVEAANKLLATQRMKRSGQRWGRDGGQGVLSFRSLYHSDRFDRAWSKMVPKLSRDQRSWKPPNSIANDNQIPKVAA